MLIHYVNMLIIFCPHQKDRPCGFQCLCVTFQTGAKFEAFFARFSRKTRVQRRAAHAKRIGIAARKRYMTTPFEGAWTVTSLLWADSWLITMIVFCASQYYTFLGRKLKRSSACFSEQEPVFFVQTDRKNDIIKNSDQYFDACGCAPCTGRPS